MGAWRTVYAQKFWDGTRSVTRKKTWAQLAAATALFAGSVSNAQEQVQSSGLFSYNYLFTSLAMTELDSGGIELGGSFEVTQRVHVFASYQNWELGENVDRSIFQIGGGYRWDLSSSVDAFARLSFGDSDLDGPGRASIDDEGILVSGGLRGWITDDVELSGELLLDDSLGSDVEVVVEFGGQYYVDDRFSLGGRIRVDEDEMTLFLGGRFYFRGFSRSPDPDGE